MEKITKKDRFNEVIALARENDNEELAKWAEEQIAVLGRKSANRTPASQKKENIEFSEKIVEVLSGAEEPMTTTEIGNAIGVSTSKATSLLKGLVAEGRIVRKDGENKNKPPKFHM